ncbi:MAG: glycosyltransferase [Caldilineaceae bacterium]|nr:glycosyltransferase [Caldilineaceae bacterium]
MRVAFLTPTLPWPANTGGTLRTYHLLRGLAGRHPVDLFSFHYGPPPATGPLATICDQVIPVQLGEGYSHRRRLLDVLGTHPRSVAYFYTPTAQATMARHLHPNYALIVCDEVILHPYLAMVKRVPSLLLRPKIDHLHYAEMAAERPWGIAKLLDLLEARRLRRYEVQVLPHYAGAVVCSQDDQMITNRQSNSLPVTVIPNGADTAYFQPVRQPDKAPTVLLLGTMHYYPNVDSVHYFFETMYPALRARFPDLQVFIVGHQPPPEICALANQPGVTVTGSVEDVRPYMARSWLLAVPLRLGGGTRLKITEAFAAGLPVVSTTIGAQGLTAQAGQHLLLADEPHSFITAIEQILTTPPLAQQLAVAGRRLAESAYSWQALGEQFATVCEQTAT